MPNDKESVRKAIQEEYVGATNVLPECWVENFIQGSMYYSEFDREGTDPNDNFCYCFAPDEGRVEVYDDGEQMIKAVKVKLDARRNILQRLNEFSLTELIGAVIALTVTGGFVYLSLTGSDLNQDFLGIFALIAGYYFGKNLAASK